MKKAIVVIMVLVAILSLVSVAHAVAFPQPFVNNDTGTVIVIGSNQDMSAAQQILDSLGMQSNVTDSFLFQRASNKLNLGEKLTGVQTGVISNNQLPSLLANGVYENARGDNFDYNQKISLSNNLLFTVFRNNDYKNNDPSIGINIPNGKDVLNYSIDFTNPATSTITDGELVDFDNTEIQLMGKTYTIVSASPDRLDLLGGATEASLNLDETQTFVVNGTSFTINAVFIDTNQARLDVNGQLTRALTVGDTVNIAGTTIAITGIDFQNFAGGVQRVQFLIGASRLTLINGSEVRIDDNTIQGLMSIFDSQTVNDEYQLRMLSFIWKANDNLFIAPGATSAHEAILPGFKNLRFLMTSFITPTMENLTVQPEGNDVISLGVMTIDSNNNSFDLPILFSDGTTFTSIGGGDNTDLLATSDTNTVIWNDDTDQYLVASWNGPVGAESHILNLNIGTNQGSDVVSFEDRVTGDEIGTNIRVGDSVTDGQVELTVISIDRTTDTALISINTGGSFNRLFTNSGLEINLPISSDNPSAPGAITLGTTTDWTLNLTEADINDNAGEGQSFGIPLTVDAVRDEVAVRTPSNISGIFAGGIFGSLGENRDVDVGWINSPLATRVESDTSGQGSATITYHGGESFGQVYLTSGTGNINTTTNVQIINSSEISSFENENLIVVGGTCVNSVAADVLGITFPTCGSDWQAATNVTPGEFIISTFVSPYNSNNIATLVAGYERQDTVDAASYLVNEKPNISEGQKVII